MPPNPSNHVVAIATAHSVAATVEKASLRNWVMVIEKVPLLVKLVTETLRLIPLNRIRGLDIGLDGAGDTVELGKIRRDEM